MQELSWQCMLTALTEHIELFSQSIADRSHLTMCFVKRTLREHSRYMKKSTALLVKSSQLYLYSTFRITNTPFPPFPPAEPGASSEPVLLSVLSWFDRRAL